MHTGVCITSHPVLAAQARAPSIAFSPCDSVGSPAALLAPFLCSYQKMSAILKPDNNLSAILGAKCH